MSTGKLIVIEGLDGCGKTTQLELLKSYLNNKNIPVNTFANVSDNAIGKCIRELGINSELYVNSYQAGCLYLADLFVTDRKIRECVISGKIALCSRHLYSTIVYGANGNNAVKDAYYKILDNLLVKPDIVIYIRMTHDQIHSRISNRNIKNNTQRDVFELEHKQQHYNRLYDDMFLNNAENARLGEVIVVDGNQDINAVFSCIVAEISKRI